MGSLHIELIEIKKSLTAATTLEAIGDIFRMAFKPWAKAEFTKERFEAGEIFAEVFSQLAEKEQATALELYDFLNMSLQCDVEEYADNEKYKQLIAQGKTVNKEQIRNCLIDEGDKFLSSVLEKGIPKPTNSFGKNVVSEANWIKKLVSKRLTHTSNGVRFNRDEEPLSGYLQKVGDRIAEELKDEYPSYAHSIKNIVTGKLVMRPKNKQERVLVKKVSELTEKYILEYDDVPTEFKNIINRTKEYKGLLKTKVEPDANHFFEELGNQSGISKEEAAQWAKDNVYIASNVAKKLDDLLYPVEQFRKDMAELYRYVGGKLGPVEIIVKRGTKRAWASGRATICLDSDFTKRTLFHECGHLVEHWDDATLQGSLAFIQGRATGEPASLKSLTGYGAYRPDEKAYPDNFIDPYVGKVYSWASSEVFSMGLQHLSNLEDMYALATKDEEHFKLMLGQCLHKNPLLAHKAKAFMEETSAKSKKNEDKKQKIDVFLKALDKAVRAIASALENMLVDADETVPGYSLRVWPKECVLYWNISEGNYARLIGAPKKYALRAAYIHLLGHNGQLPISYNPLDQAITESIKDYALGVEVPEWFEPDKGLPTLDLGEEFAQNAKDMNESAANEAQRKKIFKKALKDAVPDWLEAELCDGQGIDGYEMLKTGTKASLYSEHYYAKFLFEDKKEICLMLAYLLICNYRNILPQTYGPDMRAKYNFIDFVKGKKVPDWFDENTKLPSLE